METMNQNNQSVNNMNNNNNEKPFKPLDDSKKGQFFDLSAKTLYHGKWEPCGEQKIAAEQLEHFYRAVVTPAARREDVRSMKIEFTTGDHVFIGVDKDSRYQIGDVLSKEQILAGTIHLYSRCGQVIDRFLE